MKLYRLPTLFLSLALPLVYADKSSFTVTNHSPSTYYVNIFTDTDSYHDDFYGRAFYISGHSTKTGKIRIDSSQGSYLIGISNTQNHAMVYKKLLSASHTSKLACDIYTGTVSCISS